MNKLTEQHLGKRLTFSFPLEVGHTYRITTTGKVGDNLKDLISHTTRNQLGECEESGDFWGDLKGCFQSLNLEDLEENQLEVQVEGEEETFYLSQEGELLKEEELTDEPLTPGSVPTPDHFFSVYYKGHLDPDNKLTQEEWEEFVNNNHSHFTELTDNWLTDAFQEFITNREENN